MRHRAQPPRRRWAAGAVASTVALALATSMVGGASVLTAGPAQAAPGDPFDPADPLVFVAQGIPTGLYQAVTDASGTVAFQSEGPTSSIQYNSIAYNTADNYLYGISATAGGSIPAYALIRIGQEGTLTRVGTNTFGASNVGVFGPNNHLYINSSTTTAMPVVNVATGALVRTITLSQRTNAADLAYANGFFWGLTSNNNGSTSAPSIVRVNPTTGAVNFFAAPVPLANVDAGAAWTFGNGNLGFSSNGTGVVSQIAVTNPGSAAPTFRLVSQSAGPSSANNDGAASPGLPTDLSIVKSGPETVVAGETVTYTLTVTNNGPGNSSGFVVNDTVPAPLTNVATTSEGCTVTGNDVRCIGGRTLAGEMATYTVTATVPAGATDLVQNTATVAANENDPNPGNNTSTTTANPVPLIDCAADANVFNTAYDAATGGFLPNDAKDANWQVAGPYPAGATVSVPPADADWAPANVGKIVANWADSPYGNANWISQQTIAAPNQGVTSGDWYYRFQFRLDDAVDTESFALAMNFLADNSVAEVFVNGEPQSGRTTGLPQTPLTAPTVNPGAYNYAGFHTQNAAETTLDSDWQTGLNTIVVQVKSNAPMQGFDAQVRPSALCPQPALAVTKSSDATADTRPGDTVTYTVTARNTGTGPFTAENPAVLTDDLTGVLDDATYAGDAAADRDGAVTLAGSRLSWTGALPVGETVTLTYTVTVRGGGDGVVRNVAFAGDGDTPACDPPAGDGTDPVTGVPCATTGTELPRLSVAKSADRTDLPATGGTVQYSVTVTNEGPGDYTVDAPATATDDLADVLDDATLDEDGITASVGAATFADGEITWSGPLAAGQQATITYTVTYTGAGDNVLVNRVCVPADQTAPGALPCDSVQIPASNLEYWKTVDPASGTAVLPGQEVTYTLTFRNDGQAAGAVSSTDDLSDVLDDADLVSGPTVSDPALDASVAGTELSVTGSLPVDSTVTVAYTVRVKALDDQGDGRLGNVLTDPNGVCLLDCSTQNPVTHLSIDKTSDAAGVVSTGDTVTYTVTVTNDGQVPFTDEAPATATDDLSGVLDDASFDGAARATAGAVSYAAPVLTWTGPLEVGGSASFTYSVTVTNTGDHVLENTASLPAALCAEGCGTTVTTDLPHVVPGKTSDPAPGEPVRAGDVVTYTLTFTNDGTAAGPVDATDDLSGVLDDAAVTSEPVSDTAGVTATRTDARLRVVGELAAGATATVTYEVTVNADGDRADDDLANVLVPDVPVLECTGSGCSEVPPPSTQHPVGALDDWKTVDPVSGTAVRAGQQVTYTLHFANTGEGAVEVDREDVLAGVLDDADLTAGPAASDGALSVSEVLDGRFGVTGTLAPGQAATVTYTVTVRGDGERGDDRLGNFLVDPGQDPPAECVPVDGSRPDCTVNHVSDLTVAKTADPEPGTAVEAGQEVTYTLTFTSTATSPDAPAEPVAFTDHMADVLDDATLVGDPVVSGEGLTAAVDDDTIVVTGELAAGATATVTYTVAVKEPTEQGNGSLGNVVAPTGTAPLCVEGSPLCTVHEVEVPPAPSEPGTSGGPGAPRTPLATTGSTLGWIAGGAALLVLLGVVAVVVTRQRRTTA